MSKGLYFLSYDEDYVEKLEELLKGCFDRVEIFIPIGDSMSSVISFEEFANSTDDMKSVELKIIDKFSEFEDCAVLVVGDKRFGDFNAKIAKDLDIPVVISSNECGDLYSLDLKNRGVKVLGVLDNKDIFFTNNNKNISLSTLEVKPEILLNELNSFHNSSITPVKFEYNLYKKASFNLKTIVLPESEDERILKSADILLKNKAVNLIILGDEKEIEEKALNLGLNLKNANIINNLNSGFLEEFANEFYLLRKHKGMTLEKAKEIVKDKNYFATMLVLLGKADAMVSGAIGTTADTIRPALQIIKTKDGVSSVSGAFIMCLDSQILLFADCAIMPNPTASELAGAAISSYETAKSFGIDPKIAMLSYSTGESGSGESVDKVKEATNLAKKTLGDIVDGPLQFDAAIDKIVAKKKMPNSNVAGNANVFIFPDLNSGNIAYKAVQRLTGAVAMGPILQGLKKPINDLSRGALVEDIVNTVLISAIQAGE